MNKRKHNDDDYGTIMFELSKEDKVKYLASKLKLGEWYGNAMIIRDKKESKYLTIDTNYEVIERFNFLEQFADSFVSSGGYIGDIVKPYNDYSHVQITVGDSVSFSNGKQFMMVKYQGKYQAVDLKSGELSPPKSTMQDLIAASIYNVRLDFAKEDTSAYIKDIVDSKGNYKYK